MQACSLQSDYLWIETFSFATRLVEHHFPVFFLLVGDPVSRWWALVLKAAVHWLQGDDVAVRTLLAEAERMPRALHTLE